jgi:hypothetical protein
VIVSTPQDVALVDARKGVGMFKKVNIPVRPFYIAGLHDAKLRLPDRRPATQHVALQVLFLLNSTRALWLTCELSKSRF